MKEYLEKIIAGEDLTFEESYAAMTKIMNGNVNNSHLAGFLIALKSKGETAEEIAGSVQAMRDKSIKINCSDNNVIDVCGTGGGNSKKFYILNTLAFLSLRVGG